MKFIIECFDHEIHKARYFDSRPKKTQLKSLKVSSVNFDFYTKKMYDISDMPITHMQVGMNFEGKFKSLPSSLKCLGFEVFSFYNQPFPEMPRGLETLDVGYKFNQQLNLENCVRLKSLSLGASYDRLLDGCLPPSLEHLEIHCKDYVHDLNNLLRSLPNLKVLRINSKFNRSIDLSCNTSLTKLEFNYNSEFKSEIRNAQPSLKYLEVQHPIAGSFPTSLRVLELGDNYDAQIDLRELTDLVSLTIRSNSFNHSLDNCLPPSLECLEIDGDSFNQDLNDVICSLPRLRTLEVGSGYTHTFDGLPDSITDFTIENSQHPQKDLERKCDGDNVNNGTICDEFEPPSFIYSHEPYIGDIYGNKIGECDDDCNGNGVFGSEDEDCFGLKPGEWEKC